MPWACPPRRVLHPCFLAPRKPSCSFQEYVMPLLHCRTGSREILLQALSSKPTESALMTRHFRVLHNKFLNEVPKAGGVVDRALGGGFTQTSGRCDDDAPLACSSSWCSLVAIHTLSATHPSTCSARHFAAHTARHPEDSQWLQRHGSVRDICWVQVHVQYNSRERTTDQCHK